ncbi:MAG TPA: NUDIX domain-containing protein [Pyrinomonadaceae bacterium]|nr:NUDIX domain-containing protein [Pyrinomonadaceae bacterium]
MKDSDAEKQKPKFPIVDQISAGGVAFRRNESAEIEVAVVAVKPSRRWQLPKGIIDAGETPEIAALREVREEAGIETELLELIEKVEYWYVGFHRGERVRFHKFVYFYLLKYLGGDVENHDHEIAEARWVSVDEAIEMLAFKSEKQVIEKAFDLLKKS